MTTRTIISMDHNEVETPILNVEAVFTGENEQEVLKITDANFEEMIKKFVQENSTDITDEQIRDCIAEGTFIDNPNFMTYELHVMAPEKNFVIKGDF